MKTKVKTVSKKKLKKIAEQLAGPASSWITIEERNAYIRGVMDGMERCNDLNPERYRS